MKTKIFTVFCSLLLCVSIFACFPINASASGFKNIKINYNYSLIPTSSNGFAGKDCRDMSVQDAFYSFFIHDYYLSSYDFSKIFSNFDDFRCFSGSIIIYNSKSFERFLFYDDGLCDSIQYDPINKGIYFDVDNVKYISFKSSLNNYCFSSSYASMSSCLFTDSTVDGFCFRGFSFDGYEILYSDYDIYNYESDDLYHASDAVDPFEINDDWFDLSCDPQLSDDMSFSTTYTDPKGNEQTAADYTLDVTISKTGDMFKDSSYEHLLNYYTQCFMFVSTEPVSERDYSAALNSCIYLHYENRQYYGNVVFDADYTVKDDIELWTGKTFGDKYVNEPVAGSRSMGVTSYSLITGYVPYAVFSGSNDAHYTVDLNGVPLEAGQTYYITVLAFPMSSTFLRNSDLSSSYPMTSLSFRSSVDDSLDESGNFSPQQLIQEAEDFSGVFVVGKSAAFSLNNLNGYKFVDKSSEFGVDPYTYSDDKLHADKYEDTITDRTDYTKKGNGFTTDTPSPDFVQKSLFGFNSSSGSFNGILSSLKSVVPFYTQVVDCFPDNIQTVLILLVVFPLICILIGVIIAGIKFLISLFTG